MLKEEFDAMNAKKDFSSLLSTVGLSTNRNTFPISQTLSFKILGICWYFPDKNTLDT